MIFRPLRNVPSLRGTGIPVDAEIARRRDWSPFEWVVKVRLEVVVRRFGRVVHEQSFLASLQAGVRAERSFSYEYEPMPDRLILLDVDGVLGASITRTTSGEVDVRVSVEIAERVRVLAAQAAVVWATSWDAEVRYRLAAELGLPVSTGAVVIVPGPDAREAKRRSIDRFLRTREPEGGWRTIVWIDDGIRKAERGWADSSGWPITLIEVESSGLLTDAHVDAATRGLREPPAAR